MIIPLTENNKDAETKEKEKNVLLCILIPMFHSLGGSFLENDFGLAKPSVEC